MSYDDPEDPTADPSTEPFRARTIVVRWWRDGRDRQRVLRGTIRDISGKPLGGFSSIERLFGLLRRLLDPPDNSGPRDD